MKMNKFILAGFAASMALQAVNAAEPVDIYLWPDGAPNSNGVRVSEQDSIEWNIVDNPVMHLFEADQPSGKVVLMLPGGGYRHLGVENEGFAFVPWYNQQGITTAILRYRMPNGHPEVPLSDVHQAMRILRERYPDSKIGVQGFSAGGHLASTAATHFTDSLTRPDFAILYYPVIAMSGPNSHEGSRIRLIGENPTDETVTLYNNHLQVTTDTPPTILFHSSDDTVVPVANSLDFYSALVANNVPASLHIYPTGGHGWGFYSGFLYWPEWTLELSAWLSNLGK